MMADPVKQQLAQIKVLTVIFGLIICQVVSQETRSPVCSTDAVPPIIPKTTTTPQQEEDADVSIVSQFGKKLNSCLYMIKLWVHDRDVFLIAGGRKFHAHKKILADKSTVFAAMFNNDTVEAKTGVVFIEDIHADMFQRVITFIYWGKEGFHLDNESVLPLCLAADKYDLVELKQLCTEYIERNMSGGLFFDALAVANTYKDAGLAQVVRKYFAEHSGKILETDEWKRFQTKNCAEAIQFLVSVFKENASEGNSTGPIHFPP